MHQLKENASDADVNLKHRSVHFVFKVLDKKLYELLLSSDVLLQIKITSLFKKRQKYFINFRLNDTKTEPSF